MFAIPAAIWAVFLPSLKQGLPDPIPVYERMLLDIAVFCGSWKWLLAVPIPIVLFTVAAFTSASNGSQQNRRTRRSDDHAVTRPGRQGLVPPCIVELLFLIRRFRRLPITRPYCPVDTPMDPPAEN
jgi:hypothetical protein